MSSQSAAALDERVFPFFPYSAELASWQALARKGGRGGFHVTDIFGSVAVSAWRASSLISCVAVSLFFFFGFLEEFR